jgi:hypothetical protein
MSNYNLLDENNEDDNNFYYLTENENNQGDQNNENNQNNYSLNELNENIYQDENMIEENNIEHMKNTTTKSNKPNKNQVSKKEFGFNWLYVFLIIIIISLVAYYLIQNKYFDGSVSNTTSPSSLGSKFMSLH